MNYRLWRDLNHQALSRTRIVVATGLTLLSGCGTNPTYYSSADRSSSLGCLSVDKISDFYRINAISPRLDGRSETLFAFAVERLDRIFSGSRGVYHHLFHDRLDRNPPDTRESGVNYPSDNKGCTEDRRDTSDYHVAVSAFSMQPAPALESDKGKDVKGDKEDKGGKTDEQKPAASQGGGAVLASASDGRSKPKPATGASPKPKTGKPAQSKPQHKKPIADNPSNPKTNPASATVTVTVQLDAEKPKPKPEKLSPPKPLVVPATNAFDVVQKTQIVISSYLYSNQPADRLDKVYTLITPIDPGVEFLAVDESATNPKLIDFGTQKTTNEASFSALPFASVFGQSVSVTPKFTRELERKIRRQFTTQNVEIFPLRNVLLVSEDGGPAEADISGNKSVTVTIRIPAGSTLCRYHTVYDLVPDNDNPNAFAARDVCYVDRIPAAMGAVAVVRKVVSGATTIQEDDDSVSWVPFKSFAVFDLWRNPAELYGIDRGIDAIAVYVNDQKLERLLFGSFAAALKFRGWLVQRLLTSNGLPLLEQRKLPWIANPDLNVSLGLEAQKGKATDGKLVTCVYRKSDNPKLEESHIPIRADKEFCNLDN